MIFEKKINYHAFNNYIGKHFNESWYTTIIDSDKTGWYVEDGIKKVLFKFQKNVIPQKYGDLAVSSFLEESKKKHSNRGIASGILDGTNVARHLTKTGQNEGNYVASNISGYFDRPLREHRGILGTNIACRTTAFNLNNIDLWNHSLPFIKKCSDLFKSLSPIEWLVQKKEWNKIHRSLKIPSTVFTTITSNYNWRTACHCDSGDHPNGLGNLIVLGKDFTGGYLGFPQFKVLIKIKPNDFLLMDSHQFHCNTKIKLNGGFRLSFVMYIREDMSKCIKFKKINKSEYLII